MNQPVLAVSGLVKEYVVSERRRKNRLTAVNSVDLTLSPGETVALIGESGSGKSTVARCVARLVEPDSGQIVLEGRDITGLHRRQLWQAYRRLQMVFQDPFSSLNPRMTIRAAVEEPLRLHTELDARSRAAKVVELLAQVGLRPELAERYPRQLSGGECQRVAIARALAVEPGVLLLDEPTASLDVSVRRHILELLVRIQKERGIAYLFISHDLGTVRSIADRVLVMYLGSIVEEGSAEEIFDHPTHPYTRALLSAETFAEFGRTKPTRFRLAGEITSAFHRGSGCRLAPRCPLAQPTCVTSAPAPTALSPTHVVRCPIAADSASFSGDSAARKEEDDPID